MAGEFTGVVAIAYTVVALQLSNLSSDQSRCNFGLNATYICKPFALERSLSGLEVPLRPVCMADYTPCLSNHALLVFITPQLANLA